MKWRCHIHTECEPLLEVTAKAERFNEELLKVDYVLFDRLKYNLNDGTRAEIMSDVADTIEDNAKRIAELEVQNVKLQASIDALVHAQGEIKRLKARVTDLEATLTNVVDGWRDTIHGGGPDVPDLAMVDYAVMVAASNIVRHPAECQLAIGPIGL